MAVASIGVRTDSTPLTAAVAEADALNSDNEIGPFNHSFICLMIGPSLASFESSFTLNTFGICLESGRVKRSGLMVGGILISPKYMLTSFNVSVALLIIESVAVLMM